MIHEPQNLKFVMIAEMHSRKRHNLLGRGKFLIKSTNDYNLSFHIDDECSQQTSTRKSTKRKWLHQK